MSARLYKYIGASYLDRVFVLRNYVTIKCSYPKDFNDPYELFLTVNFKEGPEALAYYSDVIGDLPQIPVTCFSLSPSVIPMWAHYAENTAGIILEFDEGKLEAAIPGSQFGSIDYRDGPDPELTEMLYRAFHIGKPRYLYLLSRGVFSSAYYSKATCWKYEQERRMLVDAKHVRTEGSNMLADIPRGCLSAIICGPRASAATIKLAQGKAQIAKCPLYSMKIGRSSSTPYFIDEHGASFTFQNHSLSRSKAVCKSCWEPMSNARRKTCSWCKINEGHRIDAASRNTFRMLAHYGMLTKYMSDMDDITHGRPRK